MMTLQDVELIEGDTTCTEREYYQALQRAINAGIWDMQGSMGRAMMGAITSGHCLLGAKEFRDYWGNPVPSRDQVKAGTKGSIDFVIDTMGEDWAKTMEGVK
jgi:uncharacterized cupin superfamily protein